MLEVASRQRAFSKSRAHHTAPLDSNSHSSYSMRRRTYGGKTNELCGGHSELQDHSRRAGNHHWRVPAFTPRVLSSHSLCSESWLLLEKWAGLQGSLPASNKLMWMAFARTIIGSWGYFDRIAVATSGKACGLRLSSLFELDQPCLGTWFARFRLSLATTTTRASGKGSAGFRPGKIANPASSSLSDFEDVQDLK